MGGGTLRDPKRSEKKSKKRKILMWSMTPQILVLMGLKQLTKYPNRQVPQTWSGLGLSLTQAAAPLAVLSSHPVHFSKRLSTPTPTACVHSQV